MIKIMEEKNRDLSLVYKFKRIFGLIPEQNWCIGHFKHGKKHCALGHLGAYNFDQTKWPIEVLNLRQLFKKFDLGIMGINDSINTLFNQKTPKQRILGALDYIEKKILEK